MRDRAAALLRSVRPHDTAGKTLRMLPVDLVAELRQLDRRIDKAARDIEDAVEASGTTLTQLHGIGALTAAKIRSRVGAIRRFRSPAAFASYTGTAPIEVSSGEVVRHRLSRAGGRQTQLLPARHGYHPDSAKHARQGLLTAQRASCKNHNEAMRCLKRRLADSVYRQLLNDANPST